MTELETLKTTLLGKGWKIHGDGESKSGWILYKTLLKSPWLPTIEIKPDVQDDYDFASISISGSMAYQPMEFSLHNMMPSSLMDNLHKYCEFLTAQWNSAHKEWSDST